MCACVKGNWNAGTADRLLERECMGYKAMQEAFWRRIRSLLERRHLVSNCAHMQINTR